MKKTYSVFEARTRLKLGECQIRHLIKTNKIKFNQFAKGHPIQFTEEHIKEFEDLYFIGTGTWRKRKIKTSYMQDKHNDHVNNFLNWLAQEPRMKELMDKDKVSSLVFQVKWDFATNTRGEKILIPIGRGHAYDMESTLLFTNQVKKKSKKK
tara:strand:- start:64 stop:519 length:456 start_codon:yes stop_codon:yes gene_type:complete